MTDRFDEVRAWIGELHAGARGCRVEMRELRHRLSSAQRLPGEVWIDTPRRRAGADRQARDASRFGALLDRTRAPAATAGLAAEGSRCARSNWPRNGRGCSTSSPGCRRIRAPASTCGRWISPACTASSSKRSAACSANCSISRCRPRRSIPRPPARASSPGATAFATNRCASVSGFSTRQHLAWVRGTDADYTLDARRLCPDRPERRTRLHHRERDQLPRLPAGADSLIIFGAGYGFETLAAGRLAAARRIHYWGDIDTHGFAILDQLRAHFPQARSFLMDRDTLLAHQAQWTDRAAADAARPAAPERGRATGLRRPALAPAAR